MSWLNEYLSAGQHSSVQYDGATLYPGPIDDIEMAESGNTFNVSRDNNIRTVFRQDAADEIRYGENPAYDDLDEEVVEFELEPMPTQESNTGVRQRRPYQYGEEGHTAIEIDATERTPLLSETAETAVDGAALSSSLSTAGAATGATFATSVSAAEIAGAAGVTALAGAGIAYGTKKLVERVNNKGLTLPGSDYVGPGNPINIDAPRSGADAIAKEHDVGKPETLADCSPGSLLIEELPLCDCGPLNMSTHSSDSPERIPKREYNDMVDKLASMSQIKRGLEEENCSLQALLKEHEENYNAVLVENEHLKKTLIMHEKKLEHFQNLQQEYVESNSAFQMAESNNRELKLKLQQSEKICANLQQKLDEIVEQKCEATVALDKVCSSLAECRKELSAQKEAYERLRLKYDTDKLTLCNRITTLEDVISGLESKNKILNEIKSELELKIASVLEESTSVNNSWRSFLSDSSSGSSICLQSQGGYCHQFCGTESIENYRKTLYAELQASGDLCLTHKQLEDQLREWQDKATKCKQELDEYKENEKVTKEIIKLVVQHLELSEHCGDTHENKPQMGLIHEVENITKFMKAEQSLSYLISFVTTISEKEQSLRKLSEQCLVHTREVSTQTDPMVTMLSIMDQTVRISRSDRGTQAKIDSVMTTASTMEQTAQVTVSEKYTQTDPVLTEFSMMVQTAQISASGSYAHTDSAVTKLSAVDQTPQIFCMEKFTQANSEMMKVATVDQSTQISSSETDTHVESGATHPYCGEDRCTRPHISIQSHPKTSSQMADNLSPVTEPLIQTLLLDEETRCGAQESHPPMVQASLQYSGNDVIMKKASESCGAQETKSSVKQTCTQPAVNDMFKEKTCERTFHSELLQRMKKSLKAVVSFKILRRICTLAVSLIFIFVIGSSFLNLFVDCCMYSNTFYGTLCSVIEDLFKPYVELRHLSPPPT